jgi:hypothetical protein
MGTQDSNRRLVTAMFNDRDSAERAFNTINSRGYTHDDVHVIMSDKARDTHFGSTTIKTELGNKALEGAGVGSAIGTTLGAIAGAVAAIGTNLILPGLGARSWTGNSRTTGCGACRCRRRCSYWRYYWCPGRCRHT